MTNARELLEGTKHGPETHYKCHRCLSSGAPRPGEWCRPCAEDVLSRDSSNLSARKALADFAAPDLARQVTQLEAQLAERNKLLEKLCDLEAAIEHLPEPMCANLYEIIDAYRAQSKEPK